MLNLIDVLQLFAFFFHAWIRGPLLKLLLVVLYIYNWIHKNFWITYNWIHYEIFKKCWHTIFNRCTWKCQVHTYNVVGTPGSVTEKFSGHFDSIHSLILSLLIYSILCMVGSFHGYKFSQNMPKSGFQKFM